MFGTIVSRDITFRGILNAATTEAPAEETALDWQMTEEEWKKVMRLFALARDRYNQIGDHQKAQECDNAIALVQQIALDLRL